MTTPEALFAGNADLPPATKTFEWALKDENWNQREPRPPIRCRLLTLGHDVSICFDGYGDYGSTAGHGCPVMIEHYDGVLRLLVWGDINQQDPTHIIDLEGALEAKRVDDDGDRGRGATHHYP